MVRRLIEWGVNVNAADMYGNTPLYYAVRQKAPEIVRILLDAGAAVNTLNRDGISVLKESLAYNPINHDVVRALLDAGADMHEKYATGKSIVERVAEMADKDPVLHGIFSDHQARPR
jgi:ankyrin repeat protein